MITERSVKLVLKHNEQLRQERDMLRAELANVRNELALERARRKYLETKLLRVTQPRMQFDDTPALLRPQAG